MSRPIGEHPTLLFLRPISSMISVTACALVRAPLYRRRLHRLRQAMVRQEVSAASTVAVADSAAADFPAAALAAAAPAAGSASYTIARDPKRSGVVAEAPDGASDGMGTV